MLGSWNKIGNHRLHRFHRSAAAEFATNPKARRALSRQTEKVKTMNAHMNQFQGISPGRAVAAQKRIDGVFAAAVQGLERALGNMASLRRSARVARLEWGEADLATDNALAEAEELATKALEKLEKAQAIIDGRRESPPDGAFFDRYRDTLAQFDERFAGDSASAQAEAGQAVIDGMRETLSDGEFFDQFGDMLDSDEIVRMLDRGCWQDQLLGVFLILRDRFENGAVAARPAKREPMNLADFPF
jgi:hypothetical protein